MSRLLFVTVFISTWLGGCSPAVPAPNMSAVEATGFELTACHGEALIALHNGKTKAEAWDVYDSCLRSYGLRDAGGDK